MRTLLTLLLLVTTGFAAPNYKLVWSDEFNYAGLPDPTKWNYDVGGWGWGNNELQYYTNADPQNSWVDAGALKINVVRERTVYNDWRGNPKSNEFTSARLNTYDRQMWKYGRFEARMKLPKGVEVWPAFWLVPPAGSPYGQWPSSGEIDILENWGADAIVMHGSVHTQNNYGGTSKTGTTWVRDATDSFHVYSLDWTPDTISVSLDGLVYFRYVNPKTTFADWPFDQENFIILNVAISGDAEDILATPVPSSQSLEVDYVRVYQLSDVPNDSVSLTLAQSTGGTISASPAAAKYLSGSSVQIKAVADNGYTFTGWTQGAAGKQATDNLALVADQTISATFAKIPDSVSLTLAQTTGGTITVSPAAAKYLSGSNVQIKAVADNGYLFAGWTQGAIGKQATDNLTLTANQTLSAAFAKISDSVTVTLAQTSGGTVSVSPIATKYAVGTMIQIKAVPDEGYQFGGWTQGATDEYASDDLILTSNLTLSAKFTNPNQGVVLAMRQTSGGRISISPSKESYQSDEKVQIKAIADNGYVFAGWATGTTSQLATDSVVVGTLTSLSALFVSSDELIANGGFDLGWKGWGFWYEPVLKPTFTLIDGATCVRSGGALVQDWYTQMTYAGFGVRQGSEYVVNLVARASTKRTFAVFISQANYPRAPISNRAVLALDTSWKRFNMTLKSSSTEDARLEMSFANDTNELCFDSVSVKMRQGTASSFKKVAKPGLKATLSNGSLQISLDQPGSWLLRRQNGVAVGRGSITANGAQSIRLGAKGVLVLQVHAADGSVSELIVPNL